MSPRRLLLLLAIPLLVSPLAAADPLPRVKVSDNRRFLVTEGGAPFFYLADTAWELFHRASREDAEEYLRDRAAKGYTVIQAVALPEFGCFDTPNRYGHLPLVGGDVTRPDEGYFEHVDWVVKRAGELGLYTALVPTWGDKVNKKWGAGPEVFTPENARIFGEWLGRRYKEAPVIWVNGGDRPIENERHRAVFRALAEGLRAGDGAAHLITFHPMGGKSSSEWVHDEAWLDFNMLQSGHHGRNNASYRMIERDYARTPTKPTLDGEPNYEDHPVRGSKLKDDWFGEWDVRKELYWSVFAGGCGVTYGCHPIWQFWDGKSPKLADPRHSWREALALPGAAQAGHLRRLIESRPYLSRIPDQTLIVSPNPDGPDHAQATRDASGSYAFVYHPTGQSVRLALSKLSGKTLRAAWWDPRFGKIAPEPWTFENTGGEVEFKPPTAGAANDWVLVLDDLAKYPAPPALIK